MYSSPNGRPSLPPKKVTVPEIRARKGARGGLGEKGGRAGAAGEPLPLAVVTAYDFTMARLIDEAGVDVVLVGDSLGMVIQGLPTTLPVTLEEIAYHGRAVARGVSRAHVVADLPFMSYQVSPAQAVESAGKLLKEGACESVKLEGGVPYAEHVRRIVRAGVPVMGHVGLMPQSVHALGGFRLQGRGEAEAARVLADAKAIEEAGAYAIVLEAIPPDVAARVTDAVSVPTIGIGAGPACDGQVLVCTDLLGLARGHAPRFAKRYAELGDAVVESVRRYVGEVRAGAFPAPEHAFKPNRPGEPFEPGVASVHLEAGAAAHH
ncbi:MAG: 3-methyl-2-oxobutanoate hydroxymethyltransferase [Myxococcales bacterium]|nr:3-methyl-2-oxobutanoate hydroxymethyltransferase [Myxococcales bacterium]